MDSLVCIESTCWHVCVLFVVRMKLLHLQVLPHKRHSTHDRMGGGSKSSSKPVIKVSISVKEDVKLHEAENAWKPAHMSKIIDKTDLEKKTEVSNNMNWTLLC